MITPPSVVIKQGPECLVLARIIREYRRRSARLDGLPVTAGQLDAYARELEFVGTEWRKRQEIPTSGPVRGRRKYPEAEYGAEFLTVAEAAERLGLSERRVRQLAPELGARQRGGRIVLLSDAVTSEAERRTSGA